MIWCVDAAVVEVGGYEHVDADHEEHRYTCAHYCDCTMCDVVVLRVLRCVTWCDAGYPISTSYLSAFSFTAIVTNTYSSHMYTVTRAVCVRSVMVLM